MPIRLRDNDHIRELRATTDLDALRTDVASVAATALAGRPESTVGDEELQAAFERASPGIEQKYGVDIWDAMVLLAPPVDDTEY